MKKCLSWLLVLVMVLAMVPMTAFAEQTDVTYVAGEYQGITIPAGGYINVTVDATASAMTLVVDNGYGYWDWYVQAGMMTYYPSVRGSAEIELEAGVVYTLPIYNTNAEEDIIVGVSAAPAASTVGTWDSPAALVMGVNTAEIEAGASDGYYWGWTATGNGDLFVEISMADGWMYNVSNLTTSISTDIHWSDDAEIITSETIAVSEGDEILVMACTYDPASYFGAPAGSVEIFAWFEPGEVVAPPTTDPETVTYENVDTPTGYEVAEGVTPEWVDITEAHTAVLGSDGYYHLDSEDGDIIIVKMTADNQYGVNLPGAVGEGRMKIPVRDENGSIVAYKDIVSATKAYIDAANDGWVYLTSDLIYIFQGYGAAQGWYMSGYSFYLGDLDFDPDTAWMLSCATVPSAIKGDVNGDGFVDEADVAQLLWYTLFPQAYEILGDADFDGDGEVNESDVAYLLWHTLFPESYPI